MACRIDSFLFFRMMAKYIASKRKIFSHRELLLVAFLKSLYTINVSTLHLRTAHKTKMSSAIFNSSHSFGLFVFCIATSKTSKRRYQRLQRLHQYQVQLASCLLTFLLAYLENRMSVLPFRPCKTFLHTKHNLNCNIDFVTLLFRNRSKCTNNIGFCV